MKASTTIVLFAASMPLAAALKSPNGPLFDTQASMECSSSSGVCTTGKWSMYYGGKDEGQCKQLCDSFRTLVPVPTGLVEKVYKFKQDGGFHTVEGDPEGRKPDLSRTVTQVYYKSSGSKWSGWTQKDHFYATWKGTIRIETPGNYEFTTKSDDGSRLFIRDSEGEMKQVVDNPGWHGMRERSGDIFLSKGDHEFVAEMFEGGGGAGMELRYKGEDTGDKKIIVPETAFPGGILEEGYYFKQNGKYHDVGKPIPPMEPLFTRDVHEIMYKSSGQYWDDDFKAHNLKDHFYVRWEGYVKISEPGEYTFYTDSDDGSRLYIDDTQVVDNPGWHGMRTREGKITLTEGKHAFWAEMFEGGGGAGMKVHYKGPDSGNEKVGLPGSVLSASLSDSKELMLPADRLEGGEYGLCVAYSSNGDGGCILYSECAEVGPSQVCPEGSGECHDQVCQDSSFNWDRMDTFSTCKYDGVTPIEGPIAEEL